MCQGFDIPRFSIAVADLGGGRQPQPQGSLTHPSTGSAIQGGRGRTWGVEALLIPSQLAALPVRSTGTTTNVDMVTGNDDYLVIQVRTGDDETNQYWIVGPDDFKARLGSRGIRSLIGIPISCGCGNRGLLGMVASYLLGLPHRNGPHIHAGNTKPITNLIHK